MSTNDAAGLELTRVKRLICPGCQKTLDVSQFDPFSEIKCPECGMRQIVPAQFGDFLLVKKLGAGGMGVIYHAVDKELGRHVALKVMKKSLGENAEFVQSFKHEAQAAAALNHRNVVQIYSFGQTNGQPYIVMELVSGGRLDEMIADGKKMEEARALTIHMEVAEGLKAASDVGLIHSDIKPANILFGQNGEAKVVDFGLASYIGQQQSGQVWGTPYYIAPEKARGKKVDFRSDIYSLGATLFHVLAGQPPFDGPTPTDVVVARLHNPAPSLTKFRDDLHPETIALVARMLEADPNKRYPSYPALLLDMRAAFNASQAAAQKKRTGKSVAISASTTALAAIATPQRRRKFWKIAGIAAIGLLAVAGGVFGWVMHQKEQARIAAELAAKQRLEDAFKKADESWQRITALVQHIAENTETYLKEEENLWQQAVVIGNKQAAPKNALIALDALQEYHTETEEIFARCMQTHQRLAAATTPEAAEPLAQQLDSAIGQLGWIYQAVEETAPKAKKEFQNVAAAMERAKAAQQEAKKRAAEAEAQRKRELEEKRKAEELAREAEKRRPVILQQEYDELEKARAANAAAVAQRNFKSAAQAIAAIQSNLTQPETKAYAQSILDTYQILDELFATIIKTIPNHPGRQLWNTPAGQRDITGADQEGITISLGAAGAIKIKWEQVTVQQVLSIVIYYFRTLNTAPEEKNRLLLGAALLCYETGGFQTAEKVITELLKLAPEQRAEIDRLMPGLAQ